MRRSRTSRAAAPAIPIPPSPDGTADEVLPSAAPPSGSKPRGSWAASPGPASSPSSSGAPASPPATHRLACAWPSYPGARPSDDAARGSLDGGGSAHAGRGLVGRQPRAVSVACHDLRTLLLRTVEPKRAVWAHRHDGRTDLVFLGRGLVRSSRSVPAETPQELVREIQRTLLLLQWRDCQALWISGDDTERLLSAPAIFDLGFAVAEPPYAPDIHA